MKWSRVKYFLKICVSLALVAILLIKIDLTSLFKEISAFSPMIYLLAQLLGVLAVLISAWRWNSILNLASNKGLVSVAFKSQFYSTVLVGQASGDVTKLFSKELASLSKKEIAASVILDKAAGFSALMALGLLACLFEETSQTFQILAAFHFIFFLLFFDLCRIQKSFVFRISQILMEKFRLSFVSAFFKRLASFQSRAQMGKAFVGGLAYQLANIATFWLIVQQLGIQIGFVQVAWIFSILSIGLFLPISIAGFGVREWTLIGLLGRYGATPGQGVAASLVFFSLTLIQALIGFAFVLRESHQPERMT